jgi:hypothetical protein
MKTYGDVSAKLHGISQFIPGERVHGIQWIGGWIGRRTGMDDLKTNLIATEA